MPQPSQSVSSSLDLRFLFIFEFKEPFPVQSCWVEPHDNQSVRSSLGLISTSPQLDCSKLSRPVLIAFLQLCVGKNPLLALGSESRDPELQFNWETELPTFRGVLSTVVPFLVLLFFSDGIFGTQRGMFRSYAKEENEVACPRGLIFPAMVEATLHASNDPQT